MKIPLPCSITRQLYAYNTHKYKLTISCKWCRLGVAAVAAAVSLLLLYLLLLLPMSSYCQQGMNKCDKPMALRGP